MGSIVKLGSSGNTFKSQPCLSPRDVDDSILESNRRATQVIWSQVVFFLGKSSRRFCPVQLKKCSCGGKKYLNYIWLHAGKKSFAITSS